MPVTAVASVPRERYTSERKNRPSVCLDLWFDRCACAKGGLTIRAGAYVLLRAVAPRVTLVVRTPLFTGKGRATPRPLAALPITKPRQN
jgi:hypothetical protein